jgi:glutamate racemase
MRVMKTCSALLSMLFLVAPACAEDIRDSVLGNPRSPYYVDFAHYPRGDSSLPVGVFDSGTGGLTVLEAMLRYDEHRNDTGAAGADGVPDFATEDLIYLADQANMPYGNYPSVGKTDLLVEHVLKCAQFLLGSRYYADGPRTDKKPVKAIVIACNTATAYGKADIEKMLERGKSDLQVIGVIDAGARAALAEFQPAESGSIGVFATAGTVASGGYTRAIERFRSELGHSANIRTYSQGGVGLAEAIDQDSAYIDRRATAPRESYKGPLPKQLDLYAFDMKGMLANEDCSCVQINSPGNYVRYHLVSLLETMRQDPAAQPLKALILGCTHYPYVAADIEAVLNDLRGRERYRGLIAPKVSLIDPARNTARELYDHLHSKNLANRLGSWKNAEFYISVPHPSTAPENLEPGGARFTHTYKYARTAGQDTEFVQAVPFSRRNIPVEVAARLREQVPTVFGLIQTSPRTRALAAGDRL